MFQFSPSCWRDFDLWEGIHPPPDPGFNLVPRVGGISTKSPRSHRVDLSRFNLVPRVGGISTTPWPSTAVKMMLSVSI